MTALAVAPSLFDQLSGEPTLDDLIVGAWEGLTAHQVAECPVCDGELAPRRSFAGGAAGGESRSVVGQCRTCATVLS
jgi:hypothetical protein